MTKLRRTHWSEVGGVREQDTPPWNNKSWNGNNVQMFSLSLHFLNITINKPGISLKSFAVKNKRCLSYDTRMIFFVSKANGNAKATINIVYVAIYQFFIHFNMMFKPNFFKKTVEVLRWSKWKVVWHQISSRLISRALYCLKG